jgi:8-oxo-dGTP pyrophosphatase MutT (NUDIX family)
MKRAGLMTLLNNYHPHAAEEITFKDQILAFIDSNADCFERSLEIGHITASCWLLNKDGSHALLTHHAKLNRWLQLGGHCDGDSDVLAVAIKEAQEESGIMEIKPVSSEIFDIDIHLIPESKKEKAHYHYDIRFLLQVASEEKIIKSSESKDLLWISKKWDIHATENLSLFRMFTKWIDISQNFF